jgi:23S rRNA (cytosine1962-C5)-methyltransferase
MRVIMTDHPNVLSCPPWKDYALLDSGDGRKLERYGHLVVDRPEPQALWAKTLSEKEWGKADAAFVNASEKEDDDKGAWEILSPKARTDSWPVGIDGISMQCRLMSFRHMGLFPEQRPHWSWIADSIKNVKGRAPKVLNLFGYTGAASLLAAKAGAEVTHLDASKKAIQWAKDNQMASGLGKAPIRWICDDASAFVARELRRGNRYDGILLDPPKYGRGPDGEIWRFETDIRPFLKACADLLTEDAKFMIVTAYAMRFSSIALNHVLHDAIGRGRGGKLDHGELWLTPEQPNGRPLPTSLFARWSA